MSRKSWVVGVVFALIAGMIGSFGGMAFASHQFNDVDNGNFFHDNVSAIKEAGCAGGFNDNTFRTNDAVNRGQFTLWFQNCLPRVARSSSMAATTFPAAGNTPTVLLTDTITIGGFPGETQFLRITGVADVFPTGSSYSCPGGGAAAAKGNVSIEVGGVGPVSIQQFQHAATDSFNNWTYRENIVVDAVIPVTTGDVISYSMRGASDSCSTANGIYTAENRSLTAQTIPFGPTGTATGP
ncbi:MAG: S-layer homology domain-containing protein [Actinomycetota bacterium]